MKPILLLLAVAVCELLSAAQMPHARPTQQSGDRASTVDTSGGPLCQQAHREFARLPIQSDPQLVLAAYNSDWEHIPESKEQEVLEYDQAMVTSAVTCINEALDNYHDKHDLDFARIYLSGLEQSSVPAEEQALVSQQIRRQRESVNRYNELVRQYNQLLDEAKKLSRSLDRGASPVVIEPRLLVAPTELHCTTTMTNFGTGITTSHTNCY
jgi:hypothetical protein